MSFEQGKNLDFCTLSWFLDVGVSDSLGDAPIDRTKINDQLTKIQTSFGVEEAHTQPRHTEAGVSLLGMSEAYEEAVRIAKSVTSLEELSAALSSFEGIGAKKTAGRFIFSSGNPKADIMIVGDVPSDDEERQGFPFAGEHGNLLDRAFLNIGLSRQNEDAQKSLYLTNLINWRLPGNRTPTDSEWAVSVPFLERHIQLVEPKILVLCGGQVAKTLLGASESINRLRNKWHDYSPITQDLKILNKKSIPTIVTYSPLFLLQNALQKKSFWRDLIEIAEKIKNRV